MRLSTGLQAAVSAFAVVAVMLHTAIWVSCALQFAPGSGIARTASFLMPICTPDGVRMAEVDFPVDDAGIPGDRIAQNECPTCSLMGGAVDVQIVQTNILVAGFAAPDKAPVADLGHSGVRPVISSIIPRAPPALSLSA